MLNSTISSCSSRKPQARFTLSGTYGQHKLTHTSDIKNTRDIRDPAKMVARVTKMVTQSNHFGRPTASNSSPSPHRPDTSYREQAIMVKQQEEKDKDNVEEETIQSMPGEVSGGSDDPADDNDDDGATLADFVQVSDMEKVRVVLERNPHFADVWLRGSDGRLVPAVRILARPKLIGTPTAIPLLLRQSRHIYRYRSSEKLRRPACQIRQKYRYLRQNRPFCQMPRDYRFPKLYHRWQPQRVSLYCLLRPWQARTAWHRTCRLQQSNVEFLGHKHFPTKPVSPTETTTMIGSLLPSHNFCFRCPLLRKMMRL